MPDLIIFEGDAQLSGEAGMRVMNTILDLAQQFKVRRIFTGAAFPVLMSHNEPSVVYGAANKAFPKGFFTRFGIRPMKDGHISGLNGLLVGLAQLRGIAGACLLATMPHYATGFNNPRASRALVQTFGKILGLAIDLKEIDSYISQMDSSLAIIEEKVKDILSSEEEKEHGHEHTQGALEIKKKIPDSVMSKIERLFRETKKDKSKAIILKRELDRWDLYNLYEDRFLSLFKDNQ